MNLVNELQVSAENDDVLTVLRKAKRLASKLERDDIAEWLQAEQDGYPSGQDVPEYRQITTTYAYNTNGLIPAGYGRLMNGVQELPACGLEFPFPVTAPIATVLTWVEHDAKNIYHPIEAGSKASEIIRRTFRFDSMYANQITFLMHLNGSQITAIPERIKDKVLDWALKLERAGVTGEGMTFSPEDKRIAHSVVFNITDSKIGQLSNSGINRRTGE
jgi:hypothetical protein